jgi:hypothetical protein
MNNGFFRQIAGDRVTVLSKVKPKPESTINVAGVSAIAPTRNVVESALSNTKLLVQLTLMSDIIWLIIESRRAQITDGRRSDCPVRGECQKEGRSHTKKGFASTKKLVWCYF